MIGIAGEAETERGSARACEAPAVRPRAFPWPYRGMLAICSDIDSETPTHFAALHRFLNTRESTPLGEGLGLDVSDSFWFYAPHQAGRDPAETQMSFFAGLDWQTRSRFADRILSYIRCGWIDTLHTYGNFSDLPAGHSGFTRAHAERALEVLSEAGLSIGVWSNHGDRNNIQNVGRDDHLMGDQPEHPARHSDLMLKAGMSFVWSSFMSPEFRRDRAVTLVELRDGQKVWQFARQDYAYREDGEELARRFGAIVRPTAAGLLVVAWHPRLLHVQLSPENLAELIAKGGYAIVGQHLGFRRTGAPVEILSAEAVEALRRLKSAQDAGDILVARTSRLLEYAVTRAGLQFATTTAATGKIVIDVLGVDDPVRGELAPSLERLRGISFEATGEGPIELLLRGRPIDAREFREHRLVGGRIIQIPWFRADHADYTP